MNSKTSAAERPATEQDPRERKLGLAVAGGLMSAIAASSCCILPLVLFALGVSGAWIGNLAALAPYQPVFVIITLALLGYGFWMVYRRPACMESKACARPVSDRLLTLGLWAATGCIAAALAFPFVARMAIGD